VDNWTFMNDTRRFHYEWQGDVSDQELEALHAAAFDHSPTDKDWSRQLQAHSLGWVTARLQGRLVGFVNVAWDGGKHAFLVDTAVDPGHQGLGIGEQLVRLAVEGARSAGCTWLHVDFEPRFQHFYVARCGFHLSQAGAMRLF
jgi:ribosomal protein S18 acetylase RimI-like enzyme